MAVFIPMIFISPIVKSSSLLSCGLVTLNTGIARALPSLRRVHTNGGPDTHRRYKEVLQ